MAKGVTFEPRSAPNAMQGETWDLLHMEMLDDQHIAFGRTWVMGKGWEYLFVTDFQNDLKRCFYRIKVNV